MPSQLDNPPGWQEPLIDLRTGLVAPRWRPFLSRLTAVAQAGSENWTTAQRPTGNALWVGRTGYNTTLGKLETWDGSAWQGALIEPLTLTGAAPAAPATATLYAGAGRWVLIERKTASASATLDFTTTIDARFSAVRFTLYGIQPATDDVSLQLRVSEDGGATWKAGAADYEQAGWQVDHDGATASLSTTAATALTLAVNCSNNTAGNLAGTIKLFLPGDATVWKSFRSDIASHQSGAGVRYTNVSGRYYGSTNAVNGVRFLFSAGNIQAGTIMAEGLLAA